MSRRACGILLHPTSLPGPYGCGDLGGAERFLGLLAAMRQGWWQILPPGPTGYGDSPYQSFSSFALNPMFTDLDALAAEGWLRPEELQPPAFPSRRVDFGAVIPWRMERLALAADRFLRDARSAARRALARFEERQADWLPDFALFMALKAHHGGRAWVEWDPALARREAHAIEAATRARATDIVRHRVWQFWLDRQWRRLRRAARARGIRLIGDVPIFAAHDSADVWSRPELFQLDERGQPRVVAGVPPDYFSLTGQLWGNPLYDWPRHERDGFAWWIARIRRALDWTDLVRVDHFRGFAACWEIPGGAPTAEHGRWIPAPGEALFRALRAALGRAPILAEDLGVITPDVIALRDGFGLPGMSILQFEMHRLLEQPPRRPERGPHNRAVYTGTHDNDTARGWFETPSHAPGTPEAAAHARQTAALLDYVEGDGRDIHWRMIELAWRSGARWALAPLQDVLGLGREGRMNTPGVPGGNWQWRFEWADCTPDLQTRLAKMSVEHGRAGSIKAGRL